MASLPEKRKKQQKHEKKKKKSKSEQTLTLENLKALGHQLLSSRAHINNLPVLLSVLSPSSPLDLALESLISLQSFFVPLVPEIPSSSVTTKSKSLGAEEAKDHESVYRAWLRSRFDEFVNSLIDICVSFQSDDALKDVALDAIMDFVKLGKEGRFQSAIYHKFLQKIVHATSSVDLLLDLLVPKYFKYVDVRYFTYTSLNKIAKDCESTNVLDSRKVNSHNEGELSESRTEMEVHIIYSLLSRIPPTELSDKEPSYEMWSQLGLSSKEAGKVSSKVFVDDAKPQKLKALSMGQIVKKVKSKFTRAWLSFLKLPLPLSVYKEVLATLHQHVIPYIANPSILCDFLTRSYDIGGVISVMALSGLFVLMTQHGLEYPKFYEKLYALLTPSVFMAKHRAVFFQLLDSCLKSSHLPAYLAAAFVKKLSRLTVLVPPSGELVIIAIIHNMLRRHPSINFLVNQQVDDGSNGDAEGGNESTEGARKSDALHNSKLRGVDFFKFEESDPVKSDAMRSSLWEVDTLRHHYCPAVSRFIASLENDLTVRAKTSEMTVSDFSSGSYATIFREEIRRRIKQAPVGFYQVTPDSLFSELDFPGWNFKDDAMTDKKLE